MLDKGIIERIVLDYKDIYKQVRELRTQVVSCNVVDPKQYVPGRALQKVLIRIRSYKKISLTVYNNKNYQF
jgi:hypothetical protein